MTAWREVATRRLQREILEFFVQNSQAADNLEGVARWRLTHLRVQSALRDTQEALDWLVSKGYLDRIAISGVDPIFRINRRMLGRAENFISQTETVAEDENGPVQEESKMQVTITNQARYLLICTLNSGKNLHLSPGESSAPLEHLEINGNEKVAKLARNGSIAIATTDAKPSGAPARRARKEKEE